MSRSPSFSPDEGFHNNGSVNTSESQHYARSAEGDMSPSPANQEESPARSLTPPTYTYRTGSYALPPPSHDPTGMYTRAYEERINQGQSSAYSDQESPNSRARDHSYPHLPSAQFTSQMPRQLPSKSANQVRSPGPSPYGVVEPDYLEKGQELNMSSQGLMPSPKRKFGVEEHLQRPNSSHSYHDSRSPDPNDGFVIPQHGSLGSYPMQRQYSARPQRRSPGSSEFGGYEVVDDEGNVVDTEEYEMSPFGHQSTRKNQTQRMIGRDYGEEELFVDDESDIGEFSSNTRTLGRKKLFSSNDFQRPSSSHARSRRPAGPRQKFNDIGKNLAPSRYSGADMPWLLNQDPVMVPQSEVSDATLKKRRLSRGEGDTVCKRGYGANDPENIAIVNMYDIEGKSFPEIVQTLNDERIARGHKPTLTVCGVTGRYSRNAPLLYQSNGMVFVPLSQRSKKPGQNGQRTGQPVFDDNIDELLVKIVQDDEAEKWERVSKALEEQCGVRMDANAVAHRFALL
ncbi:hypothetical protein BDZ45DRAFT_689564 [Acephala macrosclerotiorum]|nr:hypothetical protein BDZ45DRAFT_689564 [Acephala macrosclerotiorum]